MMPTFAPAYVGFIEVSFRFVIQSDAFAYMYREGLLRTHSSTLQFIAPSAPSVARLPQAAPCHPYLGINHRSSPKFMTAAIILG